VNKPEDLAKLNFLKKGMSMNYQHHWIVDNMPVSPTSTSPSSVSCALVRFLPL
jgi:hypothetical protein